MANTGTELGALSEAINDKMDRDIQNRATGIQTVVETWHEGTEWYRVWSDGWIEQGGFIGLNISEITFHKPFTQNPVFASTTKNSTGTGNWSCCITSPTTMRVLAYTGDTRTWYACGY